jgi:hypothetical protein
LTEETGSRRFSVLVRDNFHYMDEDDVSVDGTFDSYDGAVLRCQAIVEASLLHAYRPGISADELFEAYTSFGDDPSISPSPEERFSAWDYARRRCAEICADG